MIYSLFLSRRNPHPNEHYRIPHKEASNVSFSSSSSSYDSSDDEIKYDFKLKSLTNDPDYSPREIYSDEEVAETIVKKKGGRHGKCRDAGIEEKRNEICEELSRDAVIEGERNEIRGELNADDLGVAANTTGSKSSKRWNPKRLFESHPILSPCACKRKCLEGNQFIQKFGKCLNNFVKNSCFKESPHTKSNGLEFEEHQRNPGIIAVNTLSRRGRVTFNKCVVSFSLVRLATRRTT